MATIQTIIQQWQLSLQKEIDYLKEQGGSKYLITNGKVLSKTKETATYWFLLATDVMLPDGIPVRILYKNHSYEGVVVSIEGFDLIVELDTYIGNEISEAELYSEPWELLVALDTRLSELTDSPIKLNRVKRLLSGNAPAKHTEYPYKTPLQEMILRAKYNPTTYIWGPPGTGKTYTLSRVIGHRYIKGKKILVLAHSNAAIDVLMYAVTKYVEEKGKWKAGEIIRYGTSRDTSVKKHPTLLSSKLVEYFEPNVEKKKRRLETERVNLKNSSLTVEKSKRLVQIEEELKELRNVIKEKEKTYVESAKVVGTTLSKATMDSLIYENHFDLIVVDEASMAYVPQLAFAASLGKKIIVCGDFKQLPPIALSDHKLVNYWLKEDIFHHAKIVQKVEHGETHPNLFILKEQRRMHPAISGFTNHFIYHDQVVDNKTVQKNRERISNLPPFSNVASALIDLSQIGAFCLKESASVSRYNVFSALLSIQLILLARKYGMDSIGVIAPYKAQARLLSACIQEFITQTGERNVVAATVHKFQGSERDMIIFDAVDSDPQPRAGILLTEEKGDRLVNVAVTRAKGKFIQVADMDYMKSRVSKDRALYKLMDHLSNHNKITRNELLEVLTETVDRRLQWFNAEKLDKVHEDLLQAKRNIIICIPDPSRIRKEIGDALRYVQDRVKVTFVTEQPEKVFLQGEVILSKLAMPFIIIDDEILWIGFTSTHSTRYESSLNPLFIMARLESKKVVTLLHSFLDLNAAKQSNEQFKQTVVSYRPNYTLKKFIQTWERCPVCRSVRVPDITAKGSIRLLCNYCGNHGSVNKSILNRYMEYIDLKCRSCNTPLEAEGEKSITSVSCERCNEVIEVKSLL